MSRTNVFLIFGSLILVSIGFLWRYQHDKALDSNTSEVKGVFIKSTIMARGCSRSIYRYEVNNKKYELEECGIYSFLEFGDTVLITYSNEDPSTSKIKKARFMRKHKI